MKSNLDGLSIMQFVELYCVNDYHTQLGFGKRKLLDIDSLQSKIKDTPSTTTVQVTSNIEAHIQCWRS